MSKLDSEIIKQEHAMMKRALYVISQGYLTTQAAGYAQDTLNMIASVNMLASVNPANDKQSGTHKPKDNLNDQKNP